MNTSKHEEISQALNKLTQLHQDSLAILEQTIELLMEEFRLSPVEFWRRHNSSGMRPAMEEVDLSIDWDHLEINFRRSRCFFGNSLEFRLLAFLATSRNRYLSYSELLENVWGGEERSDSAIRSAVKRLRRKLREANMPELAESIDGSESGYYALKID